MDRNNSYASSHANCTKCDYRVGGKSIPVAQGNSNPIQCLKDMHCPD